MRQLQCFLRAGIVSALTGFLFCMPANAQVYEVHTVLPPYLYEHPDHYYYEVQVPLEKFNLWLAGEVEQKRITLFSDSALTKPLPADTFYTWFFPALFSESLHWNQLIQWDVVSFDGCKSIASPAEWRKKVALSGSLQKAIAGEADFPARALKYMYDQELHFIEKWTVLPGDQLLEEWREKSGQVKIEADRLTIRLRSIYDEMPEVGRVYANLSPSQLPVDAFLLVPSNNLFSPLDDQQVYDLNLWYRNFEGTRDFGSVEWRDPAYAELIAEYYWEHAAKKVSLNKDEIRDVTFDCGYSQDIGDSSWYLYPMVRKTGSADPEMMKEILQPLVREVFENKASLWNLEAEGSGGPKIKHPVPADPRGRHRELIVIRGYSEDDFDDFDEPDKEKPVAPAEEPWECKEYLQRFLVHGSLQRTGKKIRFVPDYITLMWSSGGGLPDYSLGIVMLSDIHTTFKGQPLTDYLASLSYPLNMLEANHYSPGNDREQEYLFRILLSGKWETFPVGEELATLRYLREYEWVERMNKLGD